MVLHCVNHYAQYVPTFTPTPTCTHTPTHTHTHLHTYTHTHTHTRIPRWPPYSRVHRTPWRRHLPPSQPQDLPVDTSSLCFWVQWKPGEEWGEEKWNCAVVHGWWVCLIFHFSTINWVCIRSSMYTHTHWHTFLSSSSLPPIPSPPSPPSS